ncbi:MAG: capsular polysaccharide biosynthesis protein [Desulfuromonadales bacterium]|nr:capsular polysaccharide biosynthesis protein [Desulfuromonadales bacterium]
MTISTLLRRYRSAVVLFQSYGILRIPHLRALLPECQRIEPRWKVSRGEYDAVVGWGHKSTATRGRALAKREALPYLALEDGFLRSIAPGVTGASPLSVVVDDIGIYYDATSPSRLERMLEIEGWETDALLDRARRAIDWIVRERLSKYNHAPLLKGPLPGDRREKVLVIDQTLGDASVTLGMADAETFKQMLAAALEENPEADIIVKTHPDVLAGKKRGYLTCIENSPSRIHLLAKEVNPLSLIEKVGRVYTVTSQMGFEALLLGKPVVCFGVPFYAGWGLTHDRQTVDRRTRRRTLEELFAATYILYPRYLNPYTHKAGTIEDVLNYLTLQSRHHRLLSGATLRCTGFRWWKSPYIRRMLTAPGNRVVFSNRSKALAKADKVVVWGGGSHLPIVQAAKHQGLAVLHMEDGFLRSVGLGSNLLRPLSLVLDSCGIYFDPTRPSDLENILRNTVFSEELIRRAVSLRQRIVCERFSKYNVGADLPVTTRAKAGQSVLLVPGQVEDDASIRLGCVDICTDLGLLAEVRRQNPEAYIIYKPHPDVLAGNRTGSDSLQEVKLYCDQVVTDRSMPACLDVADEVHTLTSLAGFEALLHDKKVVCYGLPFYAGWGLTQDWHSLPRRGRLLSIDELVAGALILYPFYIDWECGEIIPVELALDQLSRDKDSCGGSVKVESGLIGQWCRKLSGFFGALR